MSNFNLSAETELTMNLHEPKWGRMASCGRLLIGLPATKRNLQQADCQSAAGCHPAPLIKLSLLATCLAFPSLAQQAARINGRVSDPTGAAVPNARLVLTQTDTKLSRVGTSGAEGFYEFADIAPGKYTLDAEAPGFRKEATSNITLDVAQVLRLDLNLQLGTASDRVDVVASAIALQTEDSQLGGVVENKAVNDLPLNGRDFSQLMVLLPGATEGTPGGTTGRHYAERVAGIAFSVNGQRSNYNEFLIDGFMAKEVQSGTAAVSPIIDSLLEFRVQSSDYSAQFGTESGGQINAVLKSGTNDLHGSLWEYLRNDAFDANNFFSNLSRQPKGEYRRNQFGAAAGGPVLLPKYNGRNRTFIYGAVEDSRIIKGTSPVLTTVPTADQRQGIFTTTVKDPLTGNPFPNNQIPSSRMSPITTTILSKWVPLPNNGTGTFNWFSGYPFTTDGLYSNWRIDHRISDKDNIFGHYLYNDTAYNYQKVFPTDGASDATRGQNIVGAWTHIFSPRTLNDLHIGYSRFFENEFQIREGKEDVAKELGIQGLCETPGCWGIPQQEVTGFQTIGEHGGQNRSGPRGWANQVYQIQDSVSHQSGSHSLSFGLTARRNFDNFREAITPRGDYSYDGRFSGPSLGDYLLGIPFSASLSTTVFDPHFRYNNFSPFIQDDWRISTELTVNLGFRYEINGRPTAKHDQITIVALNPAQGTAQLVTPQNRGSLPRSLMYIDWHDLDPRVGFAYSPKALGRKTVFRGAYGIFTQRESANSWINMAINPPFVQGASIALNSTVGNPLYFANFNLANPYALASPATTSITTMDPNFLDGRVQQWTFNIQQSLTPSTLLQVAYVGNHDSHLAITETYNQPPPAPGPITSRRPYQAFAGLGIYKSIGDANYNGLQIELEKRYTNGLQFISSYTFSKCIDNSPGTSSGETGVTFQDPTNLRGSRGLCAQDARQRYSLSGAYALPFGNRRVFGGWQINGILTLRSGQPFTVTMSTDVANTGGTTWANAVGNPNSNAHRSIYQWFNTTAFVSPPQFQFGNEGRNVVTGPGVNNVDVSLFKSIPVTERTSFQFRAEFFNALNHAQFALPGATLGTAQYGQISSASHDPRDIQLALKFLF